jgi:hypothetical protein
MGMQPIPHGSIRLGQCGERERDPYFSVVTGARYGTKTPPDQQRRALCRGTTKLIAIYSMFQVWSLGYAVRFSVFLAGDVFTG